MTELLVLVGSPGSGEPTRAREWVDADPAHRARVALAEIAKQAGARLVVQVVDTPTEECVARDATRPDGRRVGADVIRRLAAAAQWPAPEQASAVQQVIDGATAMAPVEDAARAAREEVAAALRAGATVAQIAAQAGVRQLLVVGLVSDDAARAAALLAARHRRLLTAWSPPALAVGS